MSEQPCPPRPLIATIAERARIGEPPRPRTPGTLGRRGTPGEVVRLLAVVILVAMACSGVAGGADRATTLAQAGGDAGGGGLPRTGDPVRFPAGDFGDGGDAGAGEITVTVTQIVDPFGAFGSGTPPPGFRFVYAGLSIANGTDAPLLVDPATLFVVDTGGYAYRPSDRFGGVGGAPLGRAKTTRASPARRSRPGRR